MPRRPSIPNQVQKVHVNVHLSQKLCDELTAKYPDVEAKSARVRQAVVDAVQQSSTGPNYAAIFKGTHEILNAEYKLHDTGDDVFAAIATQAVTAGIEAIKHPVEQKYSDRIDRTLAELRELGIGVDKSDEDILLRLLEVQITSCKAILHNNEPTAEETP